MIVNFNGFSNRPDYERIFCCKRRFRINITFIRFELIIVVGRNRTHNKLMFIHGCVKYVYTVDYIIIAVNNANECLKSKTAYCNINKSCVNTEQTTVLA